MFPTRRIARAALITLTLGFAQAHASLVTLAGQSFNLTYDSAKLDPYFGAPTLVGNTIHFAPSNFTALSQRGEEVVTRTATTNVQLALHAGAQLQSVSLLEQGRYTLEGAQSYVDVGGQIRLFDLLDFGNEVTGRLTPSAALDLADGASHAWQASAEVNTTPALLSATRFNLTIQNALEAYTDPSESSLSQALIFKTASSDGVTIQVSTVPEPESWALGLLGLGGVFGTTFLLKLNRRRTPAVES